MEIEYYQRINKCGRLTEYAKFNGIEFFARKDSKYYNNKKYGKLHRYIYQYYHPEIDIEGYNIHHIDENKLNNDISNLVLLTRSEHIKIHMTGENNPMYGRTGEASPRYGIKHTDEVKQKQSELMKNRYSLEKHPRWINITDEMIEDIQNNMRCKDFCTKYNVSIKIWHKTKKQIKAA